MLDIGNILFAATEAATAVAEGTATEAGLPTGQAGGPLGTLGVSWKLFIAQLVNFAIVVFVLWKFILKPIVGRLQERSRNISASLEEAQRIEEEKRSFQAWRESETAKAKKDASAIVTEARSEASKAKEEIMLAAKTESDELIAKTRAQLEEEKNRLVDQARAQMAEIAVAASEKILRQKIDATADKELIEESVKRLN